MAKDRGLRTREPLSNAVDKELKRMFDDLHVETRIPKARLLDEALELLLQKYKKLSADK